MHSMKALIESLKREEEKKKKDPNKVIFEIIQQHMSKNTLQPAGM